MSPLPKHPDDLGFASLRPSAHPKLMGYTGYVEYVWFHQHDQIGLGSFEYGKFLYLNIQDHMQTAMWDCTKGYYSSNADLDRIWHDCQFFSHLKFVTEMLAWGFGGIIVGWFIGWLGVLGVRWMKRGIA
jgi:hypothetical protein